MRAGTFYAEFTILQQSFSTPAVGVVAADYDASGLSGHITAVDGIDGIDGIPAQATLWIADSPAVVACGWDIDAVARRPLAFEAPAPPYEDNDKVGLLLNLSAGSLALYFNGERQGMLIPRGLVGPVKWAVEMATPEPSEVDGYDYHVSAGNCSAVNIESKAVPDPPADAVLATEAAWAGRWNQSGLRRRVG